MARLSDMAPTTMSSIPVTTKSRCVSLAKTLHAGVYDADRITKTPQEIAAAVLERGGSGLAVHERKQLPNLILQSAYDEFQDAFAREVLRSYSKNDRFWGRLFRSWLLEYNPQGPVGELVTGELKRNLGRLPEPLRNLAERYPVLSLTPDFRDAARALLDQEMPIEDRSALGLNEGGIVSTRLASKILVACAQVLRTGNATGRQMRVFKDMVAPTGAIHESVRMAAMVGLVLGAVERPPGEDLIKEISNLVEQNFDDPVTRKDRWPSVVDELGGEATRDRCIDTVRKWQVFRSITLFFKIIEQVVESEHKHQFPTRRDFWLGYFDKGQVTDAWVVLGSKARAQMKQIVREGGDDYKALKWASLSGGPSDQWALLMRLGDTTVMEFSHSGRARLWGTNDGSGDVRSKVPVLHRTEYKAENLRAPCPESQMFRHDPGGSWRYSVGRCIDRLAGRATRL